jgi:hypothetical protein
MVAQCVVTNHVQKHVHQDWCVAGHLRNKQWAMSRRRVFESVVCAEQCKTRWARNRMGMRGSLATIFKCVVCAEQWKSQWARNNRMCMRGSLATIFKCVVCAEQCKTRWVRINRMGMRGSLATIFKCVVCAEQWKSQWARNNRMGMRGSLATIFQCVVCAEQWKTRWACIYRMGMRGLCQAKQNARLQHAHLTTAEMGFSLTAESNEVTCPQDAREGKVSDRFLAPVISSFATSVLADDEQVEDLTQPVNEARRQLESLHRRWSKITKTSQSENVRMKACKETEKSNKFIRIVQTQRPAVGERLCRKSGV